MADWQMINSIRAYLTHSHSVAKRRITPSVAASPQTCSLRIVAFRSKGAVTGCADQVNYAWDRRRRLPRLFATRPDRTDSRGSNNRNEYQVANKLCRRSFAPRKTTCENTFFFLLPPPHAVVWHPELCVSGHWGVSPKKRPRRTAIMCRCQR